MTMLDEIIASLDNGKRLMLATIVAVRGSAPVGASSRMLIKEEGAATVGTIGGGCMEGDVVQRARKAFDAADPVFLTCHLDEDSDDGLICGGSVDILLEHLTPGDRALFLDLRTLEELGEDAVVAAFIDASGRLTGRALTHAGALPAAVRSYRPEELPFPELPPGEAARAVARAVAAALRSGEPSRHLCAGGTLILEPWTASPRLVIAGGGHVGRALSRAASAAGFRVTVVDDREKYANPGRFPEADATVVPDFSGVVSAGRIGPGTFVAVVTRGHAFDEAVLEQVVESEARYIGMIGSKKKVLAAMRALHARGVPVERLRRVHAPIGLEIGAVTAEEIAVSIVAQLIRVRRGRPSPAFDKSDDMRPLVEGLDPQPLIAS
jgi:xanthine dehydrogenase accessory factor